MKRAYVILGMKRSGHHAIAYWIAKNCGGKAILYNDCSRGWSNNMLLPSNNQSIKSQIIEVGSGKDESHIFNIEDFDHNILNKHNFSKFNNVKSSAEVYICSVLRDPYNWVASCMKMGGGPALRLPKRILMWINQAQLFLKREVHPELVRINYNSWTSDNDYKEILADKLNLKSYDKGVDSTSPRGGGSSFDKMRFKNKASNMKVLDRWRHYQGVDAFCDFFNSQVRELARRIFDMDIPDKKLRKRK